MLSRSSSSFLVLITLTLTLTLTLALVLPTCHAYSYAIISKTLPKGSYYIENLLTSKQLSPLAGTQKTQSVNASLSAALDTDMTVTTAGTGLFAIVSLDPNSAGSYCVVRILDTDSSTLQQSGLACTMALSLTTARVQVEPSTTAVCNPTTTPCKQSVVGTLAIDSLPDNTQTTTTQQDGGSALMGGAGGMGTPSTLIIIATVGSVCGLLVMILAVVGVRAIRARAYKQSIPQASITWAAPGGITETRSRPTSTHVRSETAQNFEVNPIQFSVAVDMQQPAGFQRQNYQPYQSNMMR